MSDKIRIVVDEDASIVARLDALAESEGLSRADMLRRAIRRMLFSLPSVPETGNKPVEQVSL
jgi:metal-responsive CopG/Arc/MetJ family transcriptional regulator